MKYEPICRQRQVINDGNYLSKRVFGTTLVTSFPRRQKDFYGFISFFTPKRKK
jgi:hypothetical protein